MVFSSLTFILYFLPISLLGYYVLPKQAKNYWLLLISLFFYAWGAHQFVFVMIVSILLNYIFAYWIDKSKNKLIRKLILLIAVFLNLSILFYNKYMNLATTLLNKYCSESISITNIILPIGISFFTFQAMSYVIDVYRKDTPVQKNPYYLGLYISFFPQLVAGPIVRYRTIADQIENRKITLDKFSNGVTRFMIGFSQKIILSNMISIVANRAFDQVKITNESFSVGFAWIGAIAYSLQILFDFSGYSSMAIGLGKMFGFEFMENFNYPYLATSVSDFWRRWHISLSQWFRDYVYIPLGGSRVDKKWKLIRNLFIVWVLTGIWHGANFTFVFWGFGYFVLLSFEKLIKLDKRELPIFIKVIYRIFTMVCVILGWVLFRSESLHMAWNYYKAMIGVYNNPLWDNNALKYINDYKIVFLISFICCTPIFRVFKDYMEKKYQMGKVITFIYDLILIACVLLAISNLVMGVNNPFIYFNF